ncbi:MAG: TonB-dependent receptor [Sandaracinaceae bacterium]|nr:TonB-dependent receptor [Sandaracinaceae bacterium]
MREPVVWALLTSLLLVASSARAQEDEPAPTPPAAPVLTPPRLIEAPPVTLPEGAEPLPEDVSVELTILIGVDGTVSEVSIATPIREDVDAMVLEAAQGMRFEPATRDGEPIPARVRFRYRISPPAPPPEPDPPPDVEGPPDATDPEATEATDDAAPPPEEAIDMSVFDAAATEELGVVAEVIRPEAGAAERITLQAEELTTVPGTFGEPLRVVATLPGVVRSPFGLGFFLVRGANFQNTGFFVDGFPVPLLYHLGAGPAVISSRFVQRLNFYPGGYPSSLGRYSAGVVALETAPPPTDSIRGEASIDLFRAEALLVVPFDEGRGSVAAAFRRSYYELLLPLVLDGLKLEYTDYQVRADYRADEHLSLSLFFFGSDDRLDQTGTFGGGTASEGTSTAFGYDFQRLIGRIDMRLPERVRLSVSGMLGRDGNSFTNAMPGTDGLRFALSNSYLALRADTQVPWTEELQTNFGFDINAIVFNVDATAFVPNGLGQYPAPAFTPQAAEVNQVAIRALAALYLEQIFRFGPVEISAAGRFDYMRYGDVSEVFPDPRAVIRWQVVPELLLKAASGLFTQPPSAFQTGRVGTPNLPPNRSWQSSFGAELTLPEHIEIHSTFYYSHMFDISRQTNRVIDTPDGPQRQFFVADEEGRAYGLELLIRRRIEQGLYGWLSYTLSRSERRRDGAEWRPFAFDQTHTLNMALSYAVDGWRFGAAFQLSTGRPTNTLVSTIYDADEDAIDPTFLPRGQRLEPFTRLDLRIDRDFDIGPIRGSVYVDVQNVYNATNNEGTLFSYDYSQTAAVPGLPILPTIGIRGSIQ